MEYVDGIKVSDVGLLEHSGLDCKIIASHGADLTFEQIFKHGFFHADPHPGNICILPGNVICYLDFGMMDYVDKRSIDTFTDIILGYVNRDKAVVAEATMRLVEWDENPDLRALEGDIEGFIDRYLNKPLKGMHIGDIVRESLGLFARHGLRLPPDIFFMIKAISEVQSIGLILDPAFDIFTKAAPFIKKIQTERMNPSRFIDDFLTLSSHLRQFPLDLHDLLKQLKQGKGKVRIEHRGLEPLIFGIYRSSNRIAFSFIIASLNNRFLADHYDPYRSVHLRASLPWPSRLFHCSHFMLVASYSDPAIRQTLSICQAGPQPNIPVSVEVAFAAGR